MLSLAEIRRYDGPNPYATAAVLVGTLQANASSIPALEQASEYLCQIFPTWTAAMPEPVEQLSSHCHIARIVAYWALGALNEIRGDLHHAGARETTQGVHLWLEFHAPSVTLMALQIALRWLWRGATTTQLSAEALQPDLEQLWQHCRAQHPDYQARILMQGARMADVPILPWVKDARLWQFGHGMRSRVFFESASNADGLIGAQVAGNKVLAKAVFEALGAPTIPHVLAHHEQDLKQCAQQIGWPCVTKPIDAGKGKGVTTGINGLAELSAGFAEARRHRLGPVMVEAFQTGVDHRLTLVEGKLISVVSRHPATVEGDGQRSIRALLAEYNQHRHRNFVASGYLYPVEFDTIVLAHLKRQGLDPDSIPSPGVRVTLRSNANISTGGYRIDKTAQVHPQVRQMVERLAHAIGLAVVGVDYLTPDISRSWQEVGGALVEINTTPGIDIALCSGYSEAQLGRLILGNLPGRIPIQLLVVSTTSEAVPDPVFTQKRFTSTMGWVWGLHAGVGTQQLTTSTQHTFIQRVQMVLRQSSIRALTLICSSTTLQQHGLPVDRLQESVLGVCLPEPWYTVIQQASQTLIQQPDTPSTLEKIWLTHPDQET